MHSVRLEPTKLISIGTRTTYEAIGDAGYYFMIFGKTVVVCSWLLFTISSYDISWFPGSYRFLLPR